MKYTLRRFLLLLIIISIIFGIQYGGTILPKVLKPMFFSKEPRTLDGTPISAYSEVSKAPILFVIYWKASCSYCKQQLADMQKIYPKVKERYGELVDFVSVNIGDSENSVRGVVNKIGITFPVLIGFSEVPKVTSVPFSILIIREQDTYKVLYEKVGAMNGEQILSLLEQFIQEK